MNTFTFTRKSRYAKAGITNGMNWKWNELNDTSAEQQGCGVGMAHIEQGLDKPMWEILPVIS